MAIQIFYFIFLDRHPGFRRDRLSIAAARWRAAQCKVITIQNDFQADGLISWLRNRGKAAEAITDDGPQG